MKMKKFLMLSLSLLASLMMAFCVTACGGDDSSNVPEGKVQFNFTVQLADGSKVSNAMVIVCNEGLCNPYNTDASGKVSVTVDDIAGWNAHVEYDGYTADEWNYTQSDADVVNYTFVLTADAE